MRRVGWTKWQSKVPLDEYYLLGYMPSEDTAIQLAEIHKINNSRKPWCVVMILGRKLPEYEQHFLQYKLLREAKASAVKIVREVVTKATKGMT